MNNNLEDNPGQKIDRDLENIKEDMEEVRETEKLLATQKQRLAGDVDQLFEDTHEVEILVNGTPEKVKKGDITYAQVVTFAFPDYPKHPERNYSVTYKKGHGEKPEGILSPGGSVRVHNKMEFNVKHTGQS